MAIHPKTPALYTAVVSCRYCVYLFLSGITVAAGWPLSQTLANSICAFLVMALAQHLVMRLSRQQSVLGVSHFLEWLCVLVFLISGPLGIVSVICLSMLVLASHTALWGWRWLALAGLPLVFVSGAILLVAPSGLDTPNQLLWVDWLVLAVGGVLLLSVCSIAHSRIRTLQGRQSTLLQDKHALLRYVPYELNCLNSRSDRAEPVWLTVSFVDLAGFTQAAQRLSPQTLMDLLDDFFGQTEQLVNQWEGVVVKFLGDGVLCVFASDQLPKRANVARQALRCMQQLHYRLAQQSELANGINIGVASGFCYVGDWGGGQRLDLSVIGVPVNFACRLQGAAAAHGGLLLDATTLEMVRCALGPYQRCALQLKGFGPSVGYALR